MYPIRVSSYPVKKWVFLKRGVCIEDLGVHLFRKEIGKLQIPSSAPQEQQTGHSIDVQLFGLNSEQSWSQWLIATVARKQAEKRGIIL